jgi:hypothetical protein
MSYGVERIWKEAVIVHRVPKLLERFLSGCNGFGNARRSIFPTWNERADIQVLSACAIPLPLSRSVTLQRENGDSGAESVLCAAVCELDYRLDVCRVTKGAHVEHYRICVINS